MLSHQDLQSRNRKDLNGSRITYDMLGPKLLPLSRGAEHLIKCSVTNKKEWLKKIGWKYAFFVLSLGFLAAALAGTHAPLFTAILLVFGPGTVLFLDHIHKNRWLILLMCVGLCHCVCTHWTVHVPGQASLRIGLGAARFLRDA